MTYLLDNLPDLTHIGDKYRKKHKISKVSNLKTTIRLKKRLSSKRTIHYEALAHVFKSWPSDAIKKVELNELVTQYVWRNDHPYDRLGLSRALADMVKDGHCRKFKANDRIYYKIIR